MDYLAVPYAPLIMLFGGVVGGVIGAIFWLLSIAFEINLRVITRALVGMGLILIVGYLLFRNDRQKCVYCNDEIALRQVSSDRRITDPLVVVLLSGALPGIMARPKKS